MTELRFDDEAARWLEQQDSQLRERIITKLEQAKQNPGHHFTRLKGHDVSRLRIGDYRVIADVNEETINVLVIGHRRNVYK